MNTRLLEFDRSQWKVYSYSGGPTQLPRTVLQKLKKNFVNYNSTNLSIAEISARSKEFQEIYDSAINDLKSLYNLPSDFKIFFAQGGATLIFESICYNLIQGENIVSYANTGHWSEKAITEANYLSNVHIPASIKVDDAGQIYIPPFSEWDINEKSAFTHYCDNETVEGYEFNFTPKTPGQLLIADTSSNFLTRRVDWDKVDICYAHGQKNIGISGSSVMIIRENLLHLKKKAETPYVCDYSIQDQCNGKPYGLPIVPIYVNSLMFRYIRESGGIDFWDDYCSKRSQKIYSVIDNSHGFYVNKVRKDTRSRITIAFDLQKEAQFQQTFLSAAAEQGLIELKGHRSRGGCRICLYIPTSDLGLDILADFMEDFAAKYS